MGLGRRTFAPGEVLTASNVMNYLMDQSVMNFAGTAARGSAIGTALSEGMVSYMNDTDRLEVYRAIGTASPVWSPVAFQEAGQIVKVVSVTKTDTQTASLTGGSKAALTGLSISHAVSKSTNQVLLLGTVGMMADSTNLLVQGLVFSAGGTTIGVGDSAGSRIRVTAGMQASPSTSTSVTKSLAVNFLYSPAGTASITYTLDVLNVSPNTNTFYINRGVSDTDNQFWGRSISTLTLMEIDA